MNPSSQGCARSETGKTQWKQTEHGTQNMPSVSSLGKCVERSQLGLSLRAEHWSQRFRVRLQFTKVRRTNKDSLWSCFHGFSSLHLRLAVPLRSFTSVPLTWSASNTSPPLTHKPPSLSQILYSFHSNSITIKCVLP